MSKDLQSIEDYDAALVGRSTDDQLKFWDWYSKQADSSNLTSDHSHSVENDLSDQNTSFGKVMDRVSALKRKKFIEDATSHLNELTVPQGVEDIHSQEDEGANDGNFFHQSLAAGKEEGEIRKVDYTEPEAARELSEKTSKYLETYKSPENEDKARIERYKNPDVEAANKVGSTEDSIYSGIKKSVEDYNHGIETEVANRIRKGSYKSHGESANLISPTPGEREFFRKKLLSEKGIKSSYDYQKEAYDKFASEKKDWTVAELQQLKRNKDSGKKLTDYESSVVEQAFPSPELQREKIRESKAGKIVESYAKQIIGSDALKNSKWEVQYVGDPANGVKYYIRPSREVDNTDLKRFDVKLPDGKIVKLDTSNGDGEITKLLKDNISSFPKDTLGDIAKGFISSAASVIGNTARTLEVLAAGSIAAFSKDVDFANSIAEGYRATDKEGIDPVFDKFFELGKDTKFSDYNYVKQNTGGWFNPISISQGIGQMVGQVGLAASTGGFGNAATAIGKIASVGVPVGESFLYIADSEIADGIARGLSDEDAVYGGLVSATAQAPVDALANYVALKAFGGGSSPILKYINPRLSAIAEKPAMVNFLKDLAVETGVGYGTESFQLIQDKAVEEIFGANNDWSFNKGGVFDQANQEGVLGGIAQAAMTMLGIPFKIGAKKSAAKYAENLGGDIIYSYKANFDGRSIDINITRLDKEIFRAGLILNHGKDDKGNPISDKDKESLNLYVKGLEEIKSNIAEKAKDVEDSHSNEKGEPKSATEKSLYESEEDEDANEDTITAEDVPDMLPSVVESIGNQTQQEGAPTQVEKIREKQKQGIPATATDILKVIADSGSPEAQQKAAKDEEGRDYVEKQLRSFLGLKGGEPLPDGVKIHAGRDPGEPKGVVNHGSTDDNGTIHLYAGAFTMGLPNRLKYAERKGKSTVYRNDLPVRVAYTFMHELAERALKQDKDGLLKREFDQLLYKLPISARDAISSFVKEIYKPEHRSDEGRVHAFELALQRRGIDNITNISGWDKFVNFVSGFLEKIGINPNRFIGAERMAKNIAIKLLAKHGATSSAKSAQQQEVQAQPTQENQTTQDYSHSNENLTSEQEKSFISTALSMAADAGRYILFEIASTAKSVAEFISNIVKKIGRSLTRDEKSIAEASYEVTEYLRQQVATGTNGNSFLSFLKSNATILSQLASLTGFGQFNQEAFQEIYRESTVSSQLKAHGDIDVKLTGRMVIISPGALNETENKRKIGTDPFVPITAEGRKTAKFELPSSDELHAAFSSAKEGDVFFIIRPIDDSIRKDLLDSGAIIIDLDYSNINYGGLEGKEGEQSLFGDKGIRTINLRSVAIREINGKDGSHELKTAHNKFLFDANSLEEKLASAVNDEEKVVIKKQLAAIRGEYDKFLNSPEVQALVKKHLIGEFGEDGIGEDGSVRPFIALKPNIGANSYGIRDLNDAYDSRGETRSIFEGIPVIAQPRLNLDSSKSFRIHALHIGGKWIILPFATYSRETIKNANGETETQIHLFPVVAGKYLEDAGNAEEFALDTLNGLKKDEFGYHTLDGRLLSLDVEYDQDSKKHYIMELNPTKRSGFGGYLNTFFTLDSIASVLMGKEPEIVKLAQAYNQELSHSNENDIHPSQAENDTRYSASPSPTDKFNEGLRLATSYIHSNEFQLLPPDYRDVILKGISSAIENAKTANPRMLASIAKKLTDLSNGSSMKIAELGVADIVDKNYSRLKRFVDSLGKEGVPEDKAFDTPLANWVRGFLWSDSGMAMSTTEFRKIFPFRGGWDWFVSIYAPYKVGMDQAFRDVKKDKREWADAMESIFGKKTPATHQEIKEIAIAADITQYQDGVGKEVDQVLKRISDQRKSIENKKKISGDDKFIAADVKLDEKAFDRLTDGIPFDPDTNTYTWPATVDSLIDHIERNMSSDKTRDALKKAREFGDRYQTHFSVVSMAAYGFLPPRYVNYVKRQTIGNDSRTTPKITNLGITTRESVLRDRESLPPEGYYINDINNAVETEIEEIHYELNTAIPRRMLHNTMSDKRIVNAIRGGRAMERNPVRRINEILDGIHNSFNEFRSLSGFMRTFVLTTSLGRSLQLSRISGIFKQSLPAFVSAMFQGSNEFITDYFIHRDFYKKWIEDNASFLIQRLNNFDQFLQHYNDTYHAMRKSDIMREGQSAIWDVATALAGDVITKYGIKAADLGRKVSGVFTAKPDNLTARSIFISRYLHELKKKGLIRSAEDFRVKPIFDKESFSKASMESDEIMGSASTTQERPEFFKSRDKEKMFVSSFLFALRQTDIGIKIKFAKSISRLKYLRYATSSKQAREALSDAMREAIGDFMQMATFRAISWAYTIAVLYGFQAYVRFKIDDDDEEKRKKLEQNFKDQIDLYTYYAIRDAAVDVFQFASMSPGNTGNELADIGTNIIAFEMWGDKASKEARMDIEVLKQESSHLEKTINAYKDAGLNKQAIDAMERQREIDTEIRSLQWKSQLKNFEDPLLGDMSITGRTAYTSIGPWVRYFSSKPEAETDDYKARLNKIIKAYEDGKVSQADVDNFAMFDVKKALDYKTDSNINLTLVKWLAGSPPIGSSASAKAIVNFQKELEREAIKQESDRNKKYINTLRKAGIRVEMKNLEQ